ncbi:hypothetical protein M378DRAFT_181258 [Amanita muscaria Koide BX008]|uniref:Glycosyl hydrolase family 31 C-terminal domain-containing protein n=1 Tax=Amanita muscaria (strain Koide BX008) TaxID=946122 RepID=A0A0C2WP39_AMAMK|nr:hypothetical protein M378DRAFT_181258 [Amanita muscaria Koide BX008]
MVKDTLRLRYSMLPIWYTGFREASVAGVPVLRPHYVIFPKDKKGYDIDDPYYISDSGLLVKPLTEKESRKRLSISPKTKCTKATSPIGFTMIPLLIRGSSIVPTQERPRRASSSMKLDPFTLRVALDKKGNARGELYLDDAYGDSIVTTALPGRRICLAGIHCRTLFTEAKDRSTIHENLATTLHLHQVPRVKRTDGVVSGVQCYIP